MRFKQKDFEIPQVCLDLGFEDRSSFKERAAQMHNTELELTLWVLGPGECEQDSQRATRVITHRYVLEDFGDGMIGECDTDDELRKLVDSVRGRVFSQVFPD